MPKSPEMEKFLDELSKTAFGRSRNDEVCVTCGSIYVKPTDFRNALSRKEFTISRMCQICQDSVFGVGNDDKE